MSITPVKLNSFISRFHQAPPSASELKVVKKFADENMSGLYTSLIDSISKSKPKLVQEIDGVQFVKNDTIARRAGTSVKSFLSMPIELLDSIAKKFPGSKLDNLSILQKYRESVKLENEIQAAQGLVRNTLKGISELTADKKIPDITDTKALNDVYSKLIKSANNNLNNSMADEVAQYDTKKERFATRLVSGLTAALFLGTDFYNKSIQKGKTVDEAKKEQHLKQGQEIRENVCEAITQFAVFSCFSRTVNKSVWAPAIISAGIGLISRVISRKATGMTLGRIKVPDKSKLTSTLSMTDFVNSAKSGSSKELVHKKEAESKQKRIEQYKPKKPPVLSMKNILGFCAVSIAAGYALRFVKNHTEIGNKISEAVEKYKTKFDSKTTQVVNASKDNLNKMSKILNSAGESELEQRIKLAQKAMGSENTVEIGTEFKTVNLFGKVEVKTKDLRRIATAPFRFIKELVSYPYKIANKMEEAIKTQKIKAKGGTVPKKPDVLKDTYDIKNLYNKFLEFEQKYQGDDKKIEEEFTKFIKDSRISVNNDVSSSKGNNSKIAVIAQTLGTLTGMWFNMNDEFNSSVRNGSTKEEAEKDARLRGINKFLRMTVQLIISGSLNDIFAKQYNNSIAKSAAVVAASTVLTDGASRVLSGMPTTKMTKEELDNYQKSHKEGPMRWYYKLIDKLAS